MVGGLPVLMWVDLLAAEVMFLGLWKQQKPNMRRIFWGSKDCLVSDGETVSHGKMSVISGRCIFSMSYGETESTSGGVDKVEVLGCLKVGVAKGAGCVSFV